MIDLLPWIVLVVAIFYSLLTLGLPQLSDEFKRDVRSLWQGGAAVMRTYQASQQPPSRPERTNAPPMRIDVALVAITREVEERQSLAVDGQTRARLVVVIDDTPVIARKCKESLAGVVDLVATIGRSLNVTLILLSQSNRAQQTGFAGMDDILLDAPCVKLHEHRATVEDGDARYGLDTRDVRAVAAMAVAVDRSWFDSEPVRTGTASDTPDTDAVRGGSDILTELVRRGASANAIAKVVGGTSSEVLRQVRACRDRLGLE